MSDALSAERIRAGLSTAFVGQNVVYLPQTGSTNEEARRLAQVGAPEGTLVITEYQVAGRGRLDRRWEAPPGSSLLLSLVFRPDLALHRVQRLIMVCSLAVVDAIESETGLHVDLKWPNDIIIGGAKAGGMLMEIGVRGKQVDYAVVGIGLNVNLDPAQLRGETLMAATSLSDALGAPVARLPLLWALLQAVEARYTAVEAGDALRADWAGRLLTLGRPVVVSLTDTILEGVAEGVNADGALLVRLADGHLETVLAGDVTLRSPGHGSHT